LVDVGEPHVEDQAVIGGGERRNGLAVITPVLSQRNRALGRGPGGAGVEGVIHLQGVDDEVKARPGGVIARAG
jgi:hypothetical protein